MERERKKIEEFFSLFPKVIRWNGKPEYILVSVLEREGPFTEDGKLVYDDGMIVKFESFNGRIKLTRPNTTIPEDILVAQLSSMLKDSKEAAHYCEQVSCTLLEEGECLFNAPYGLHMKTKEFEERYSSPEWEKAWKKALIKEFHAKKATADEVAGIGCFRLQAI